MPLEKHFMKIFSTGDFLTDVIGQENAKEQLKSALISNRHILIIGPPGVGKTTLAKNIARLLPEITLNDCNFHCLPENPVCPECRIKKSMKTKRISGIKRFVRIQGSPDLTAEDLIGDIDPIKAMKFGPLSIEAFNPGKIFKANNGVLFFDELNRCSEKLQNSLLQVLEEGKATIGSYDVDIPANFIFIGTMNPIDVGTERLSDVLLDRFDVIQMGYPETTEIEKRIVNEKSKKIKGVEFPEELFNFMVEFVRAIRNNKNLEKLPSVRATIGLYERASANAFLRNSKIVDFSDIEKAVVSVLSHRIKLKPAAEYVRGTPEFISEELKKFVNDFKKTKGSGFL